MFLDNLTPRISQWSPYSQAHCLLSDCTTVMFEPDFNSAQGPQPTTPEVSLTDESVTDAELKNIAGHALQRWSDIKTVVRQPAKGPLPGLRREVRVRFGLAELQPIDQPPGFGIRAKQYRRGCRPGSTFARWISMIGFEAAPVADPASCNVTAYELLVLLVPLVIAADGGGPWEIGGRTVSLGHNGRGDVMIRIEVPVTSTPLGLGNINPADFRQTLKKKDGTA